MRFYGKYSGGYNIGKVSIVKTTLLKAKIEEHKFLLNFSNFKYIPNVKFGGHTECFRKEILNVMFPKK